MDFIYGTQRVRRKYSASHPSETVVASDASKGIKTSENTDVQRGMNWVTSQRAVVLLTDKRITCGKWDIPLDDIEASELKKFNTIYGPGLVLKLSTKNQEHYQFGMQMNKEWTEQTVLPLTMEKTKVKFSPFSIIIRLLLVAYILYYLIESWSNQ